MIMHKKCHIQYVDVFLGVGVHAVSLRWDVIHEGLVGRGTWRGGLIWLVWGVWIVCKYSKSLFSHYGKGSWGDAGVKEAEAVGTLDQTLKEAGSIITLTHTQVHKLAPNMYTCTALFLYNTYKWSLQHRKYVCTLLSFIVPELLTHQCHSGVRAPSLLQCTVCICMYVCMYFQSRVQYKVMGLAHYMEWTCSSNTHSYISEIMHNFFWLINLLQVDGVSLVAKLTDSLKNKSLSNTITASMQGATVALICTWCASVCVGWGGGWGGGRQAQYVWVNGVTLIKKRWSDS